jgi:uncharacterized protein (TIGR03435 family)
MKESENVAPPKEGAGNGPDPLPPPPPGPPKMGPDGFPMLPPGMAGRAALFGIMMNGRMRGIAQQQTMKDLAGWLTGQLNRPVTDETGLTAKYDFTLTFSPEGLNSMGPMPMTMVGVPPPGGERGPAPNANDEPLPNLFAAVQSQLGLRLEAKKGPVEMIVIDHMEKTPTEN